MPVKAMRCQVMELSFKAMDRYIRWTIGWRARSFVAASASTHCEWHWCRLEAIKSKQQTFLSSLAHTVSHRLHTCVAAPASMHRKRHRWRHDRYLPVPLCPGHWSPAFTSRIAAHGQLCSRRCVSDCSCPTEQQRVCVGIPDESTSRRVPVYLPA
eukprot:1156190-Pelagomonas_calceolata.AAC.5